MYIKYNIWAEEHQNKRNDFCAQPKPKSVWESDQSDQSLRCEPEGGLGP